MYRCWSAVVYRTSSMRVESTYQLPFNGRSFACSPDCLILVPGRRCCLWQIQCTAAVAFASYQVCTEVLHGTVRLRRTYRFTSCPGYAADPMCHCLMMSSYEVFVHTWYWYVVLNEAGRRQRRTGWPLGRAHDVPYLLVL